MIYYFLLNFLIGSITSLVLGIIVYFRNKRKIINITFSLLCLSGAIWSLGFFYLILAPNKQAGEFWRWFMESGSILLSAFWAHFALSLVNLNKKKHVHVIIFYIVSMFLWILNAVDYFVKPGLFILGLDKKYLFNYYPTAGFGEYLFFLYFLFIFLYSTFHLVLGYKRSSGLKSNQIKSVLLAAVPGFSGGGMTFLLTFNLQIPPYGVVFFALYPILVAYAISRYRLMDVRLIVVRTIAFAFLIFLITSIFAIASSVIGTYFAPLVGFKSNLIIGLIIGLLVTIGYNPTRKALEKITNKYLYKKSYDSDELLSKISGIASSTLELDKLLKDIAKELDLAFNPTKIGVALVSNKGKLQIYFESGFKPGEAETLSKDNEEVMWKHFKREPAIAVIDELVTKYEAGEYQPISKLVLYVLHQHGIELVIPLYVQERLIGMLALGTKKSGDVYTQGDLNVLEIISGQLAVSIDNARLYDELKSFNITLQQRVDAATQELRVANQELRKLDKSKSEFISIASHQLRTPLTIIKGYISMMLEGSFGKLQPPVTQNLDKVFSANERLIGLVENLLDISRIESGRQEFHWEDLDFNELAKSVVGELELPAKNKQLKLTFSAPKEKVMVYADKAKLHEMMLNFVDNSIKYTPEGSVNVYVEQKDGNAIFGVRDTGRGVDKETIPYLFKKFSRGKDSFKVHTEGTGLGLYVVRMIAEAHHGTVGVESAGQDQGSHFFFQIPFQGPKTQDFKPQEPIRHVVAVKAVSATQPVPVVVDKPAAAAVEKPVEKTAEKPAKKPVPHKPDSKPRQRNR